MKENNTADDGKLSWLRRCCLLLVTMDVRVNKCFTLFACPMTPTNWSIDHVSNQVSHIIVFLICGWLPCYTPNYMQQVLMTIIAPHFCIYNSRWSHCIVIGWRQWQKLKFFGSILIWNEYDKHSWQYFNSIKQLRSRKMYLVKAQFFADTYGSDQSVTLSMNFIPRWKAVPCSPSTRGAYITDITPRYKNMTACYHRHILRLPFL